MVQIKPLFFLRPDRVTVRIIRAGIALVAAGIAFSGCAGYTGQSQKMVNAWRSGDIDTAVETVSKEAESRADGRDALLWRLEEGTIKRGAALYEDSNVAFSIAEDLVNQWEEEAKLQVGREAGAMITNLATIPYRGRAYDKILMNTFQALNYLHLGDLETARVQLNRALQRQRDAVAENARRIEEAEEQARLAREGELVDEDGKELASYDMDQAMDDERLAGSLDNYMSNLNAQINAEAYADYVNPFAVFLDGLVFTLAAYDSSDLERGRMSFARVASMAPSRYIEEDVQMAERLAQGGSTEPLTYIIYETGYAPHREEIRIDIPLFHVSNVSYIGASFPELRFHPHSTTPLFVNINGETHRPALLCNIDNIVGLDFKNEWPAILAKTLTATATKAIAAYFLEQSVADQGIMAQLAVKVMVIAYQASMNRADLRTWLTLPREFRYCRFPTPENRQIEIAFGNFLEPVEIESGHVTVIYVQGISPNAPPRISQFVLTPQTSQLALTQ